MDWVSWPRVIDDLASIRRGAATFLEDFDAPYAAACHSEWVVKWMKIGAVHDLVGDATIQKGQIGDAKKSWLCALTAFEVARHMARENTAECKKATAKIEAVVRKVGALEQKIECVPVKCHDQSEILTYY